MSSFTSQINTAPVATDRPSVERGLERWEGAISAASETADNPVSHAGFRSLLEGVFAGSPYLTNLAIREHDLVISLLQEDPDDVFAAELAHMRSSVTPDLPSSAVGSTLRKTKRRIALLIGLCDLGGVRGLNWVTGRLAEFAGAALDVAFGHLLTQSASKGEMSLADPGTPLKGCGVTILAMGKMGAWELNYSSDIDLIVIYDEERIDYSGKRSLSDHLSRMVRSLIQLMQERTGDGYVFRTDLRLRPDPSVSPLAISIDAAMTYYETLAQNWERAAMIKARPAAGDIALGEQFLEDLIPFIWRRSLDFAAIADIQSIKRQIHASKGHGEIAVAGHDIKVGRGGIREIEFFAQTQQLIAGGRDPRLRVPGTLAAIDSLVSTGRVEESTRADMHAAYVFLRQTEHRLQMLDDAQTQKLPDSDEGLERLAAFCGFETLVGFSNELTGHMQRVAEHYADLFAEAPTLAAEHGNLVFTGTDDDPGTIKTLTDFGFASPSSVISVVKSWHAGRHRAMRTTRARQLLTDLVPSILKALSETSSPDNALANFDRFLGRLPTGIQFMSLLHANPELLRLLARIMGTAPALAELLGRNAALLDVLLEPGNAPAHDHADLVAHCERELSKAEDYEGVLDAVRRFANDRRFEIGVGLLTRQLEFDQSGAGLSDVAETVIRALLPHVEAEVARRHGTIPGAGMAVIAMGKLGGRELTFGSDLDLVFVYDDSGASRVSDGPSPLQIGPFFTRLSQRFISAITALTSEGMLYEVDMRLRPSGNKGAVAVPLSAYATYMENEAWTWEIMAATRARVIGGPEDLCDRVGKVLHNIITQPRDSAELKATVLDMRKKIETQHRTRDIWSLKHVRGGLVDLEFLIQFLTLNNAHAMPEITSGHVPTALVRLKQAGLMDETTWQTLNGSYGILKGAQILLRLCYSHRFNEVDASTDFKRLAAETLDCDDFDAVAEAVRTAQKDVLETFETIVGRIG